MKKKIIFEPIQSSFLQGDPHSIWLVSLSKIILEL